MTVLKPLTEPIVMPENKDMDMRSSPTVKALGIGVIVLTIILYIVFW